MRSPAEMKIIQIEITNACERRCSNCTRFCGHQRKPFFMDFDTFKQAVDSLRDFKGIVGIMGGEPTLHPDFDRFVRYFRERIGYDVESVARHRPTTHFLSHLRASKAVGDVFASAIDAARGSRRGLWTSLGRKYYEHFELIQDTFAYQAVNDHSHPSLHTVLMATRRELGIGDEQWVKLRDRCWIQNLWSASVTPKGAFFCEVAAAMDVTLGGPGGWKIEPGWWKRAPADFGAQLRWCELCGAALAMPKRDAREEIDDVSPLWREKLRRIRSPKIEKGLFAVFDPKAYDPSAYEVVREEVPFMRDQENRIGTAERLLRPQSILAVAWLTDAITDEVAERILTRLKTAGHVDCVVSPMPSRRRLAQAAGLPFLAATRRPGAGLSAEIRRLKRASDWILLMRDMAPSGPVWERLGGCVFNPGCLYWQSPGNRHAPAHGRLLQFFNVRASCLRRRADVFRIAANYPPGKIIGLTQ